MANAFLESHNIKNQFNYYLIKDLYNAEILDFEMTLNTKNTDSKISYEIIVVDNNSELKDFQNLKENFP